MSEGHKPPRVLSGYCGQRGFFLDRTCYRWRRGGREARPASQRSGCRQRKECSPDQWVDTGTEKLGWDMLGDREEGGIGRIADWWHVGDGEGLGLKPRLLA